MQTNSWNLDFTRLTATGISVVPIAGYERNFLDVDSENTNDDIEQTFSDLSRDSTRKCNVYVCDDFWSSNSDADVNVRHRVTVTVRVCKEI